MSTRDKKAFANLIEKYLDGSASPEEVEALEAYYSLFSEGPDALDGAKKKEIYGLEAKLKSGIYAKIRSMEIPVSYVNAELSAKVKIQDAGKLVDKPIIPLYRKWSFGIAAAAVMLVCSLGIWFYVSQNEGHSSLIIQAAENKIIPGSNKAVLTLADGQTIDLSDDQSGIVVAGDHINYSDGSELGLITVRSAGSIPEKQLALSTPKGGQYQVTLSDGTKVWLNSASTIKYPARFTGTERKVELNGEAYFEVNPMSSSSGSKDLKPFIVKSSNQEVKVLGTHFNINAYQDEAFTKTTLLEGSVQVSTVLSDQSPTVLRSGQQSILSGNSIEMKNIEPSSAIDWKNGYFQFNDEELGSIMRKISRWYDVEVKFEDDNLKKELFAGLVNRFTNVGELLQTLEMTKKVSFDIVGKTIVVKKAK